MQVRFEERIRDLISQSERLGVGNEHDQCTERGAMDACSAWLTAAQNAVHGLVSSPGSPYRKRVDALVARCGGYTVHKDVTEIAAVLSALLEDLKRGLLCSVAYAAQAELLDDFLDDAERYMKNGRTNEAGVIAGVVFEDSLRKICRKQQIKDKDEKLDNLISQLQQQDTISAGQAKRARAAAHVRTKATHAQWDEICVEDVKAAIVFTRELVDKHLSGVG